MAPHIKQWLFFLVGISPKLHSACRQSIHVLKMSNDLMFKFYIDRAREELEGAQAPSALIFYFFTSVLRYFMTCQAARQDS